MTIQPFRVRLPDDTLQALRLRLDLTRWPDEPPGAGWSYGSDLAFMRDLVAHWREGYDWRAQEAMLNRFDHFMIEREGTRLHFIRQEGNGPEPTPLLLLHGWPGSVWEFHKLIPRLTDPARFGGDERDAFTVIAPSLPGYGFSFVPGQARLDRVQMAEHLVSLMVDDLGHARFAVQGGDIGSHVGSRIAAAHPARVIGLHLNFLGIRDVALPAEPSDEERAYAADLKHWLTEETGYQWIQGTKPQTLSYGLTDSPAGLAAWMIEKFRSWSDCDGDLLSVYTRDELLTAVMLYWATGAINSSFWPYYTSRHGDWSAARGPKITVPTGYLSFPKEIVRPPRSLAERVFNIRHWTVATRGGHFAALEQPDVLAQDIRAFFRELPG
ncbi:MAG TPA: epoxide hydrolase [Burkholderiaceae bacterium]|nr:epoxide hydrolase [Burkholderiaceae bacterium]